MSHRILTPVFLTTGATVLGSGLSWYLSGSMAVFAICVLVGLFATALLYDNLVTGEPVPAIAPSPESVATGPTTTLPLLDDPEVNALIEALPEPALIVVQGRIARANRPALALLGAHVTGQDVRLAIRHPAVTEYLVGDRAGSEPVRIELVGIGGADQNWELTIAPLSDARQLVLLADRSARYAAERMRVDFVANASHELRTPLAGILGFIETLNDDEAGGDAATRSRFLAIMENEAKRMQRLINDLMSLSRIEADKYRLPDQTVDLVTLVQETAEVFRKSSGGRAEDLVLDLDLSCATISGDHAQLSQLVHNLVSNAMKYGRAGTPVTIALAPAGPKTVRLSVSDEGEGIAPEHLPRLTERFYRVDTSRSRAIGGTGLGLAIVKHIVERHRGRLHIDSEVGRGTTVSAVLPLRDPHAALVRPAALS